MFLAKLLPISDSCHTGIHYIFYAVPNGKFGSYGEAYNNDIKAAYTLYLSYFYLLNKRKRIRSIGNVS